MTGTVLLDAGPALNFFGSQKHELLFSAAEAISSSLQMPEVVKGEIDAVCDRDLRFRRASGPFEYSISAARITVLDDSADGELPTYIREAQVQLARLASSNQGPISGKDLGEATVIGHARLMRDSGFQVRVLIDEWRGQKVAAGAGLRCLDTEAILVKAAKLGLVSDRGEMRKIWERMMSLDDGLLHWDGTRQLRDRSIYGSEA